MTLTTGPATDYLVTLARQAVTGITVNGKPVAVTDGEPDELAFGMFLVGISDPPPEIAGETVTARTRLTMSAYIASDEYTIPCCIDVRVGGTSQKTARDLAESIFNAFWLLFVADVTLGGVLPGGGAQVVEIVEVPHNVGTPAEPGRRQLINFGVRCTAVQ